MEYLTAEQLYPGCEVYMMSKQYAKADVLAWGEAYVPVRITKEFPSFFVGEVMPHKNSKGNLVGDKYTVTLDKFDIKSGNVRVRPN